MEWGEITGSKINIILKRSEILEIFPLILWVGEMYGGIWIQRWIECIKTRWTKDKNSMETVISIPQAMMLVILHVPLFNQ